LTDDSDDGSPSPKVEGSERRYLVVANVTLNSPQLTAKIREYHSAGASRFHLVVPATPSPDTLTWTEEEVRAIARDRLLEAVVRFRGLGIEVTGEVGDGMPLLAMEDACRAQGFDEIILSTLPPGMSRWLKLDLPNRAISRLGLPVTHVIALTLRPAPLQRGTEPAHPAMHLGKRLALRLKSGLPIPRMREAPRGASSGRTPSTERGLPELPDPTTAVSADIPEPTPHPTVQALDLNQPL
jgi:hypothetical protein